MRSGGQLGEDVLTVLRRAVTSNTEMLQKRSPSRQKEQQVESPRQGSSKTPTSTTATERARGNPAERGAKRSAGPNKGLFGSSFSL